MSFQNIWEKYEKVKNPEKKNQIKNQIITDNVSLVKIIAGKLFNYYAQRIDYEDLVGYGIMGLIDAIDKYDYKKNIKFETYASIRIRGSIIDQIRNLDWIPRSIRKKSKIINEATDELENILGREATVPELAKYLNLTEKEVTDLIGETSIYNIVSIEEEFAENYRIQITDTKRENSPEEMLLFNDTLNSLSKAIDRLKPQEKTVVNLYYFDNLTYKEIAKIIGVSESRISQIISSSLSKLKKYVCQ